MNRFSKTILKTGLLAFSLCFLAATSGCDSGKDDTNYKPPVTDAERGKADFAYLKA